MLGVGIENFGLTKKAEEQLREMYSTQDTTRQKPEAHALSSWVTLLCPPYYLPQGFPSFRPNNSEGTYRVGS